MERNIDRKTLSFGKGMTNVPSDLLSDDTELLESDGFIYRDGEMKPIQKPVCIDGLFTLLYIHKGADYRNYVHLRETKEGNSLFFCGSKEDGKIDDSLWQSFDVTYKIQDVKSVGNTVVIATDEGIAYFLYKGGKYKELGIGLPDLDCEFTFQTFDRSEAGNYMPTEYERTTMNIDNCVTVNASNAAYFDANGKFVKAGGEDEGYPQSGNYFQFSVKQGSNDGKYENEFQETVQGHVAQAINWVKNKKMFAFPFFLRCAFRMFDGSYTKITAPIICYPTVNRNCRFNGAEFGTNGYFMDLHQMSGTSSCYYFIEYAELLFKFGNVSEDWTDIIKDIVVFASDQVLPFHLDKGWKFVSPNDTYMKPYANYGFAQYQEAVIDYDKKYPAGITQGVHDEIQPTYKTDHEIIEELKSKTQFYELFSVSTTSGYLGGESWHHTVNGIHYGDPTFIADGVVENLVTQTQLKVDDYYGWAKLTADKLYTYNKRLHMIGAKRHPFSGFSTLTGREMDEKKDTAYIMFTHIVNNGYEAWVVANIISSPSFLRGWLYYPDPNAREIILYAGGRYLNVQLASHPMLNGAYSFTNLPSKNGDAEFKAISEEELLKKITNLNGAENLDSQIFTSVVNNPFLFEASGDNTVGTGRILGIVANTEAVSPGQYGQFPLIVFTTDGIYAMGVTSEGLYGDANPVSREVCNNADSITPTDRLVYFTSDKGLMAISGGTAVTVSRVMNGRNPRNFGEKQHEGFLNFLKSCIIAYDYRDSMLRIFKKSKGFTNNNGIDEKEKDYYIYNIVDGTFGMDTIDVPIKSVTNDYPDNIIQDIGNGIYSLTSKPDINEDEATYNGHITTRPLKLGGSLTLKSLRGVKNLIDSDDGKISLEIWGSNDCKHWQKLPSMGGKPWKYFTFKYTLKDFKAVDSFAGSIVEVQSRREDKMR